MPEKNFWKPALVLLLCGSLVKLSEAQEKKDSVVAEMDLPSLIFKDKKAVLDTALQRPPLGKLDLNVLPVVGYNPAYGFVAGAAVNASTQLGNETDTRQSSGLLNATVTTKDQLLLIARAGLAFPKNRYLLDIDARLLIFTQDTYGLGTRLAGEGKPGYAMPEPMSFNYFRYLANGFIRLSDRLYAGAGLAFEVHTKIKDPLLEIDSVPGYLTAHYDYSSQYGFSNARYSTNGLIATLRWDSRDNISNPYKGWYASLAGHQNLTLLGSTRNSFTVSFDGRYYANIHKSRPSHLIAFWLRGNFSKEGNVPYLALPSTSWDTYNRTGRGYIQGRFRGPSMVYFETEYRYPISRNGLLGGVVFTNFTTANGDGDKLFKAVAPAAGFGLRIKLDKESRANITVDYARGAAGSNGIFFSLQEAF